MHLVALDKKINRQNYNANSLVNWALKHAETHFSESLEEVQFIKRANQIIASQFKQADSSQLRHGTVHLDLWYDNIKVKEDGTITIFDFDNCGNGWLFLDIAYSLMLLYRNEPNKELFKDKMKSFYEGYETITTITKEEKRLMPFGGLAIWLHFTGIHIQRYDDFSNIFLSEDFLKYWIDTVNNWMVFNEVKI